MTKEEKLIEIWKLVYELDCFERVVNHLYEEDRCDALSRETVSHIRELRDTIRGFGECELPNVKWDEETMWIEEVLPEITMNLEVYSGSLTEEEYLSRLEEDQEHAEFWCGEWEGMTKRILRLMLAAQ